MRRFLTLVSLLCLAIPAGMTISGCSSNPNGDYCNGLGYGTKVSEVSSITLEPKNAGVSLYFGKTTQLSTPTAYNCKGSTMAVSGYTYGSQNTSLVDVSPTGKLCAGSWNRNSGGGIADYTLCTAPSALPANASNGLPYAATYITASTSSVTSNAVNVYVHPQTTAVSLATTVTSSGTTSALNACLSQGATATLDAQACYYGVSASTGSAANVMLCAPSTATTLACALPRVNGVNLTQSQLPSCSSVLGTLTYTAGTSAVATINADTNQITAQLPGTTAITAAIAGTTSSAGYFSTCPPKSIALALNGATSGTVSSGSTQTLTTTTADATGAISGLTLDYQSTNPMNITVSSAGAITPSYPGQASIFAVCQPPNCNPAPTEVIGLYGTGLPITSNKVALTRTGSSSSYLWLAAPGQSQYFAPYDLYNGTVGGKVMLTYVPNSMVMDPGGNTLYFGTNHGLQIYSATANTFTKEDTTVPGVVLAVSPDNKSLLISNAALKLLYIYSTTSYAITESFGGVGAAAAWTPDSKTLYIADSAALGGNHANMLYAYNANTGWTSCAAGASCAPNFTGAASLALNVPSVSAFFAGSTNTTAHTWCPAGTVGNPSSGTNSSLSFYPEGDSLAKATDALAATGDGQHILGASYSSGAIQLTNIGVTIPTTPCPGAGTSTLTALSTSPTVAATVTLSATNPTAVNQVVASPDPNSTLAFVTYSSSNAAATTVALPYYNASGAGAVTLTGVTAPVAGAFSPDAKSFYVSTAGDNKLHFIDVSGSTYSDTAQVSPNLPACMPGSSYCTLSAAPASGYVPATVIAVKPRATP